MKFIALAFITSLLPVLHAAEKDIANQWCQSMSGINEFRTKDGTYVDCLTEQYAVEVEYDNNWKEGVGQALHYAESTGKEAAIVFVKRAKSRKDYLSELLRVINKYNLPIEVFVVEE